MNIEIHLLGLVLTSVAILVGVALPARGSDQPDRPPKRRLREIVLPAIPVLCVGLLCSLLLMAGEKPLLEWLLPLAGVLLIGWRSRSERVFKVAKIAAPLVAAGLALHFVDVAHTEGVTNAPDMLSRIANQRESIGLQKAGDQLLAAFDPSTEFPPGPVRSILPDVEPDADVVEFRQAHSEWHSPLSRLYRVEDVRGTVWYPGGELETAVRQLEVRIEDVNAGSGTGD